MSIEGKSGAPLKWTDAMDSMLTKLWLTPPAELLTSAIGPMMRAAYPAFQGALTKNAIIGRATRLGLPSRGRPKTAVEEKPPEPEAPPMSATKGPPARNTYTGPSAKPLPPEPEYTPDANNVPYLEANDGQCMWPVGFSNGATIVCGCKRWNNGSRVRPSMYCAHHSHQGSGGPQRYTPKNKDRRGRPAPRFS